MTKVRRSRPRSHSDLIDQEGRGAEASGLSPHASAVLSGSEGLEPVSGEEAQAVAEAAKTSWENVKAAGGLGAYLADIVGSIPDDLLDLRVGDWLAQKRRQHLAILERNAARSLEGISAERLNEPSPSLLIPLLQAAVDEGRPELQRLWAALLANTMVDGGGRVRRDYFAAVREMEPLDAIVLGIIARRPNSHSDTIEAQRTDLAFFQTARHDHGIYRDDWDTATEKLVGLRCIHKRTWTGVAGGWVPDLTPFGKGLLAACKPP